MPRTEAENQRIRDERREQILQAAIQVFARQGYAATKIADIAAAAHSSHGLVYHYFDSKEDIFAALIERAAQDSQRTAEATLARPGDALDRVTWLVEVMLRGLQRRPELYMIMVQSFDNEAFTPELRQRAVAQAEVIPATLRRLIAEAQTEGKVAPGDPDELATAIFCCVQGLAINILSSEGLRIAVPSAATLLRLLKA